MERKCPKCGGKLGIFDLKPNCPHCGSSIMYYDMDKRLEEDSVKAEAEWQKLDEILDKIFTYKKNIIGNIHVVKTEAA